MQVRRAVLGEAYVARATREATVFDREFHELITRYVWGEIWTRPGLPRKTRRLLTLSMLVALNRGEELELHVRAALAGGVTRDEIREVLLQAAVYCGVPAAHNAFRIASQVLAERKRSARRR
jgi:4-carboxymuconolactone decarboxylase